MGYRGRLRVIEPPTAEERAAFFASRDTSVPEQIRRSQLPWTTRALRWFIRKLAGGGRR